MAELRNVKKAQNLADGERVTVGNNRTVMRDGDAFVCRLHGHPIAIFDFNKGEVALDTCGYKTRTTQQAMQDFARLFGVRLGVSFAKGRFSVRYFDGTNWCDTETEDNSLVAHITARRP